MIRILLPLLLLGGCGKPITEEKGPYKSPLYQGVSEEVLFDTRMSMNFDLLPLKGSVEKDGKFWSGDSWRLARGAINLRWASPGQEGFNYLSPTRRDALTLPRELMRRLSPSEKYDLYMGRYDYPLRWEVDTLARSGVMDWEGLCHGWAGASMNHVEPPPRVVTNPDGIEIYFGSADIKALLTYAYSKILIQDSDSLGKRCEEAGFMEDEDRCNNDLRPEAFHIVLANKLGLRGQSIIADIDRYQEVWNHPLTGYQSTLEKYISTKHGKYARVRTRLDYVDVVEKKTWERHKPVMSQMTVRYELYMDAKGNITSGKWLSRERPDFIWTVQKPEVFSGYLANVMNLIK